MFLRARGLLQFSLVDLRHSKRIALHKGQVRDIKYKGNGDAAAGYMLTTAFDKTLKVSLAL